MVDRVVMEALERRLMRVEMGSVQIVRKTMQMTVFLCRCKSSGILDWLFIQFMTRFVHGYSKWDDMSFKCWVTPDSDSGE